LRRELARERAGLIVLAQNPGAGNRAVLRERLLPEARAVFISGPVETDFG
jgi:hypothetical protein